VIRRALGGLLVAAIVAGWSARAFGADGWFGKDKALHFEASAAIALGGYGGAALLSDDVRVRLAVGGGLALSAGVGKELWDLSGHGDASWRDLTWDAVGTVTGLAVAVTLDWAITRLARRTAVARRQGRYLNLVCEGLKVIHR
jgi:putative lipoprotein